MILLFHIYPVWQHSCRCHCARAFSFVSQISTTRFIYESVVRTSVWDLLGLFMHTKWQAAAVCINSLWIILHKRHQDYPRDTCPINGHQSTFAEGIAWHSSSLLHSPTTGDSSVYPRIIWNLLNKHLCTSAFYQEGKSIPGQHLLERVRWEGQNLQLSLERVEEAHVLQEQEPC